MTDHRSNIEDIAAAFEAHVNKGSLKRAASLLPELVHSILDMVEHHAGVKANKSTVTTEAKTRASADSELSKEIKAVVAKVEDKIEAVEAKVEDKIEAAVEAKVEDVLKDAPAAVEAEKTVLTEETPAEPEKAADEAPEASDDKKPAKGKKKAD